MMLERYPDFRSEQDLEKLLAKAATNYIGRNQSTHITPATGVTVVIAKKFEDASRCPY